MVKKNPSSTIKSSRKENTNNDSKIPVKDEGQASANPQASPTESWPKEHTKIGFGFGVPIE